MLFIKIYTCACSMNTGTCFNIHGLVMTSNRKAEKLFSKKLAKLSSPPNTFSKRLLAYLDSCVSRAAGQPIVDERVQRVDRVSMIG